MADPVPPTADQIREAVLALEGTVIDDFQLPLPGDLGDLANANTLVGGILEDRIPAMLNSVRDRTWDQDGDYHAFEFRRFTIGFPDILLVERANPDNILFEMEAKTWYVLSRDQITARFETSPTVMRDGTLVAIAAWLLDGVVSGSPKILRIHTDDAKRLAELRDEKWETIGPEGSHRVVHPPNAPDTPRNLIQTKVLAEMRTLTDGVWGEWRAESDNFGKIHRIYDEKVKAFQDDVLTLRAAGKTLADWRGFIYPSAAKKAAAKKVATSQAPGPTS